MNSPEPAPGPAPRSARSERWPRPSPGSAFAERRERLRARLSSPAIFASGWPRARNFPLNQHSFRAESHFLYLVGRQLEGAALVLGPADAVLYVPPTHPSDRLWHGPEPSAAELSRELGLEVRETPALGALPGAATLPPQDPRAAEWLSALLGRQVKPGSGAALEPRDAELAEAIIELRLVHDAAAIAQMRQAASVTVAAHRAGMRATRPGDREAVVAAAMQAEIFASGMSLAYPPIVTAHGEILHARRQDGVLGADDLLLVDVGAETPEGWAADVTRTWPVSGRFSPTQRAAYDAVLLAQQAALAAVRPGARYADVHVTSQRALAEALVDLKILRGSLDELTDCHAAAVFYPHGVGHLLGLDVHDMEDLGDRAGYAPRRKRQPDPTRRYLRLDRDLRAGMVVTIEPGFYQIPDLLASIERGSALDRAIDRERLAMFSDVRGIRIEDDVLVTEGGCEVLSGELEKGVAEIERWMGAT